MNYKKLVLQAKTLIQNKEYQKAEQLLLDIIKNSNMLNIENETNTYYSFNNYAEFVIYCNVFRPTKKNILPEVNYSEIYYYLGYINIEQKNYGKALEYDKKGLERNPVDVSLMFEIAAIYRMLGEIEKFKAQVEKTYKYIYNSTYLSKYYRELGWYYVEKRVFDLANALYTASYNYFSTEQAMNELKFIAQQENRPAVFTPAEEAKKLLSEYNIGFSFNKGVMDSIYTEYVGLSQMKPPADKNVIQGLSRILYDITHDEKFLTYYKLNSNKYNVEIILPDTWKYIPEQNFDQAKITPNTAFFLIAPSNQTVNITCDGRCTEEQLDQAFNVNLDNMKKNGTIIEQIYKVEGTLKSRQAFVRVKQNDKEIRIFQTYKIIDEKLFCATWNVPSESEDLDKLLVSINNSFAMKIVNSLKINTNENTEKNDIIKNEAYTLSQINNEYTQNGITDKLVKMLHIYSDSNIKDTVDPFFTQESKNILEIIIVSILKSENNVSFGNLSEKLSNIEDVKTFLKETISSLNEPCLSEIINSKKLIDSDKPFKSVIEIIREGLGIKVENTNTDIPSVKNETTIKLKEYSQKMTGLPIFKFYFPENMGEIVKKTNNVFEIKRNNTQKLRVMIIKCNQQQEFEEKCKNWIEKNKKDAKMEEVSYKKESINNIPIEVYTLKFEGRDDLAKKIYKMGYINGCIVTISGGLVENKEKIINEAFEKIVYEDNLEDKKQEEAKSIIIDCPGCNTKFELNWNVPASEKTFYCICPNCGMELKRGNPNYKEN